MRKNENTIKAGLSISEVYNQLLCDDKDTDVSILKDAFKMLYDAINSTVGGVVITNRDGMITYVNSSFLKLFGYATNKEVVGLNVSELFSSEEIKKLSDVSAIIDMAQGETEEFVVQDKDGSTFTVEVKTSNVSDATGKVIGRMASFVNITEQKNLEKDIQKHLEELEQSNQDLQNFAFMASHDLRNPLVLIESFSERLRAKHGANLSDQGLNYLQQIEKASQRMQTLIDSMLKYSQTITQTVQYDSCSLSDVVRDVISDLDMVIKQQGAIVEVDELPKILADPMQMYQLFENLVGNALKFRKPDEAPKIWIYEASQIAVDKNKTIHEIVVEDNGIGFNEKDSDKIFGLCQRLHATTNHYEGTGLGLSICKRIVERHGGKITAQSTPGKGSKFIIHLPR